jgi:hypothetical protein
VPKPDKEEEAALRKPTAILERKSGRRKLDILNSILN